MRLLLVACSAGLSALLAAGCYLSHERERPADAGASIDAGSPSFDAAVRRDAGADAARPPRDAGTPIPDAFLPGCDAAGLPPIVETDLDLDLLFVVDNSGSMAQEQVALTENFPRMIVRLVSGDLDGDGTAEFPPVRDLHVGVITTDMGAMDFEAPTCSPSAFGDDGILRTTGRGPPSCMRTYPSFLEYSPETGVVEQLATDFACVAVAGTEGCGLEQPLEAALKAVTSSTSSIRFFRDTTGHADGANAGFLRADSFLAIVMVTDEDDCSARDGELFNPGSRIYTEEIFLRCAFHDDAMQPISRYVDGLREARSAHPERLLVAAIAGVPPAFVADPEAVDYAAILSSSQMVPRVDLITGRSLIPACTRIGRGDASPARRVVELVQGLGEAGILQSICAESFDGSIAAISSRLGTRIREALCEGH